MFGQNSFFPNNPQQGSSSQPSSQPAKPASTGTATGFDQNNIQQQTPGFQPFSQNSNNSNPSFAFNLPNPVDSGAKPGKSNPLFGNSNTTAPVFVQQPRQATFDFGKPAQTTNNGFGGSPVGRDKPALFTFTQPANTNVHGSTAPVPAKGFRFETSDYIPKFSSSLHVEKPIAPFKFAPIDSFTPPMFNRIKQPTPAIKSDLAPEQVQVVGLELSAESSLYLIKKGSACFWCGVSGNVTQKISDENHLSSAPVRYHVQGLESSMEFLVIVGNDAPFNIDIITFSKVNKKWSYHKLSGDLGVNLPRNGIIMSIPAAMWVSVDNETSTDQQNSVVFPVLNILLNTGEIVSYSCVREGLDPSDVYFHPEMDKFASKKSNDIMQMCLTLIEKARLQDGEPNVFNQVISVVMYSDGMFSNGKFYYYNVLGNCLEKILEKSLPQLFTSHRFTDGEEIELLVIDRIQVPYRLLKSKFATINSPKQPTRINYPKRPTAINSFPLQLDPGQNAIKISRFIYVSDNEITSNFSYLLRLWKKVKNQRKKEHDITAQISHILDKSLKSTDFKNGEDIRLMLATLLECLNGVEKSLLIIKESKFNDPQLESLIAAKTQTLDAVRQIVVSFEERVNAFEYLRVAHDLESLEKFRLELNKMPIAQASNGPHNVADFGTWKTYRSKTIENAKKESERQLHLLLVFFKEDDEDDSVDFSPDLFVNAISQESRILNNFDPPIETIMSVLLDAIKSKEVLMASMKEVERVFESLRHISSEWKSVRDADHSMQEYDSRYEKMIDIFGDLQKQTKNRRRAEGVLEQLTKSYRIACQAVDEEYLRLYTVGSKFFPELLLELREVCETDDLISFSRHFGSYEEQEVLYSAKHKVYRAKYQGVDCVLKEFRLDEKKDLSRFLKESRTISKLDHPNIIKIQHSFVDDGDDSKRGFLQIPFYSEGDLFKLMTSGTELTLKKRQTIAQGIMLGLEYLHRRNIIHCDLKPQNILMDGVNKPVISDFDNSFDTMEIHINTTLSTLGTFRYLPPDPHPFNQKSDIYSVGLILFDLNFGMDVRLKSTSQIGGVISISIPETTDLNLKLLLEQMLQFENAKRPFAKTCLFHPYFTTVLSDDEQQVDCLICFEKFMQSSTVRCSSGHCVCRECFNGYLSASLSDEARLWKERKGEILCVNFMCKIPYSVSALLPCLDEQSFEGLIKKKEEIRELAVASVLQEAHQKDLHRLEKEGSTHFAVRQIQEDILNMKCPRCHLVFHAFDGCFALKCRSCGCAFCAWCLQDCGKDAHSHVAKCKFRTSADALYGTEAEFRECHRVRKIRLIKHYMKQFPLETKDLLLEKIKPFLVDLNYPF